MAGTNTQLAPAAAANTNATPAPAADRYTCPRCFVGHWVAQAPPGADRFTCDHPSCRMPFWAIDAVGTPDCVALGIAPQTAAAWRGE